MRSVCIPVVKVLLVVAGMTGALAAQAYPNRVVTLIVPAPAGGATDVVARALSDDLGRRLGRPVIVENKAGAGGMLGTQAVASAKPDGYTLLFTHGAPILSVPFLAKAPYDVKRDFAFVSRIASASLLLAVHKDVPARNMNEFMAWARKNLGKVNFGSYGVGSPGHLMSAYLSQSRQLNMTHVAYKGESPLVQDLVGGQVHWAMATAGTLAPYIASGRVFPIAVLGPDRLTDLPGVPTMRELGFDDPEFMPFASGMFLLAPVATPGPVLERLEKEVRSAVQQSTPLKARLQVYGLKPVGNSSDELRRGFDAALPVMERLVRSSGASLE